MRTFGGAVRSVNLSLDYTTLESFPKKDLKS